MSATDQGHRLQGQKADPSSFCPCRNIRTYSDGLLIALPSGATPFPSLPRRHDTCSLVTLCACLAYAMPVLRLNQPTTTRLTKIHSLNDSLSYYDLSHSRCFSLNDIYLSNHKILHALAMARRSFVTTLTSSLSLSGLLFRPFHSHLQDPTRSPTHQHKLIANISQPHTTHHLFDYLPALHCWVPVVYSSHQICFSIYMPHGHYFPYISSYLISSESFFRIFNLSSQRRPGILSSRRRRRLTTIISLLPSLAPQRSAPVNTALSYYLLASFSEYQLYFGPDALYLRTATRYSFSIRSVPFVSLLALYLIHSPA